MHDSAVQGAPAPAPQEGSPAAAAQALADSTANGNGVHVDLASLQNRVRAAREQGMQRKPFTLEFPGFDGTLVGRFRGLDDYKEGQTIAREYADIQDPDDQALAIAVASLVATNLQLIVPETPESPEVVLPSARGGDMTLGLELAQWLNIEGADKLETDEEAVFLIFEKTMQIARLSDLFTERSIDARSQIDRAIQGNS